MAEEHEARTFGAIGQYRRLDVHHRSHAYGIAMMLVEREEVEAKILGIAILVEIIVVVVGRFLAIVKAIGDREEAAIAEDFLVRDPSIGPFGEITYLHLKYLFFHSTFS